MANPDEEKQGLEGKKRIIWVSAAILFLLILFGAGKGWVSIPIAVTGTIAALIAHFFLTKGWRSGSAGTSGWHEKKNRKHKGGHGCCH